VDCALCKTDLTEAIDRLNMFSGSVNTMVMLVPFTTVLPPQNDYSDYAPKNPEACHECRAEEKERVAAEKPDDKTRKPDEEPDQEDFSKVLGMLLNTAVSTDKLQQTKVDVSPSAGTIEATTSDLQKSTTSDASQSLLTATPNSSASTQNVPKTSFPEQVVSSAEPKSTASNAAPMPTSSSDPKKLDTAEIQIPAPAAPVAKADVKPKQTSGGLTIPGNNSSIENPDASYSTLNAAAPQTEVEVLPNAELGFQQLGLETTFRSATRLYESTKDTDAVTQEIMNALSRAVAATAPTRNRSGTSSLQSSISGDGFSEITNLAPLGTESIGPLNSLGTTVNASDAPLQETSGLQKTTLANSRGETLDQFWVQPSGPDADRTSNQSGSRDDNQLLSNVGHTSSPGSDGARLSSSGAVAMSLPDLTTSVTSEMRQPLSSQVSRAVIEHLERHTTAESETLTVQLDPQDLGEMVIELSKSKEGLAVRVTAREAVTMDMLLARGSEIENQLRGEKMELRSLEFLSPDMMNGGAFQRQTPQDSTSRFDQPVGTQRRSSRNGAASQISTAATTRTGDSQHALNFRA
jgi:hypothetical protein